MAFATRGLVVVALLIASSASAQSLNDAVQAYAWADNSTATSYTPDPDYSYSASGGAITATRSSTGDYRIRFDGVPGAVAGTPHGNVQVSAYGSNAICTTQGWEGNDSVEIRVACFNPATEALVDTPYTVLFTRQTSSSPRVAYAFANDPVAATYVPAAATAYNAGGGITITRSRAGVYQARFAGVPAAIANVGNVQVSAFGTSQRCVTDGWGNDGADNLQVEVRCTFQLSGPTDSRFTVLFSESADVESQGAGYARANSASAASYAPSPAYNHSGGTITATRSSIGQYAMSFAGLGSNGDGPGGTVQVTGYGEGRICTLQGWSSAGTSVDVSVFCYDGIGRPGDAEYSVLFLWPDRMATNAEAPPEAGGVALVLGGANPSREGTRISVTLPEATEARVRVLDARGREVALLHDGPLAADTTTLPWVPGPLPAGTYLVRLEAGGTLRTLSVTLAR